MSLFQLKKQKSPALLGMTPHFELMSVVFTPKGFVSLYTVDINKQKTK